MRRHSRSRATFHPAHGGQGLHDVPGGSFGHERVPSYYITEVHRILKRDTGVAMPFAESRRPAQPGGHGNRRGRPDGGGDAGRTGPLPLPGSLGSGGQQSRLAHGGHRVQLRTGADAPAPAVIRGARDGARPGGPPVRAGSGRDARPLHPRQRRRDRPGPALHPGDSPPRLPRHLGAAGRTDHLRRHHGGRPHGRPGPRRGSADPGGPGHAGHLLGRGLARAAGGHAGRPSDHRQGAGELLRLLRTPRRAGRRGLLPVHHQMPAGGGCGRRAAQAGGGDLPDDRGRAGRDGRRGATR